MPPARKTVRQADPPVEAPVVEPVVAQEPQAPAGKKPKPAKVLPPRAQGERGLRYKNAAMKAGGKSGYKTR
jgi:hypothetical protein